MLCSCDGKLDADIYVTSGVGGRSKLEKEQYVVEAVT